MSDTDRPPAYTILTLLTLYFTLTTSINAFSASESGQIDTLVSQYSMELRTIYDSSTIYAEIIQLTVASIPKESVTHNLFEGEDHCKNECFYSYISEDCIWCIDSYLNHSRDCPWLPAVTPGIPVKSINNSCGISKSKYHDNKSDWIFQLPIGSVPYNEWQLLTNKYKEIKQKISDDEKRIKEIQEDTENQEKRGNILKNRIFYSKIVAYIQIVSIIYVIIDAYFIPIKRVLILIKKRFIKNEFPNIISYILYANTVFLILLLLLLVLH
ncbi:MAG: hypothetical protein Q7T16_04725 [Candidatus Burarchaeum sp.]|nr:hypothetical protein [Candidatus Burarchaeum sp.]MDO8339933.1 hypothetical protein [Candidatus Burarchaeum sp.]